MPEKIREIYHRTRNYIKDLAVRTKAEIITGALIGTIVLGSFGHINEVRRSLFQPISYSEYEQIEDSARIQGRTLNDLTQFYFGINDYSAKVMEAYNWNSIQSIIPEFHRDWFSKKLEQEMEMAQKESKEKIASILNKRNQGN